MFFLSKGQFPLRKWRCNNKKIFQHLTEKSKFDNLLVMNKDKPVKMLGLLWNQRQIFCNYSIRDIDFHTVTKRIVLSEVSQVYDLLNLLGSVLIVTKIIMRLWSLNIGWDESLPRSLFTMENLSIFIKSIKLKIPRCIKAFNSTEKLALFGFEDASKKAYEACLYAVTNSVCCR